MAKFDLKAVLEVEVIDKVVAVMAKEDKKLREAIAKLGTRVGAAGTYAELPTVDQNGKAVQKDDVATLTQTDGDHPAGLYVYDGNQWVLEINYDAINVANIESKLVAGDDDITIADDGSASSSITDKFVTPSQIAAKLTELSQKNVIKYHPKGGDSNLKVVGADADSGTQEFVTAKQLEATFTEAEVQAKYDAL